MSRIKIVWLILCVLVLACVACVVHQCLIPPPPDVLTEQYGSELQRVYEQYRQAQVIAYETGDTTALEAVATGYAVETPEQIAQYQNPQGMAEWRKVKVVSLRVVEYYTDTAQIFLSERLIGDVQEDAPSVLPNICLLQKEQEVWKVATCYRPRDDW